MARPDVGRLHFATSYSYFYPSVRVGHAVARGSRLAARTRTLPPSSVLILVLRISQRVRESSVRIRYCFRCIALHLFLATLLVPRATSHGDSSPWRTQPSSPVVRSTSSRLAGKVVCFVPRAEPSLPCCDVMSLNTGTETTETGLNFAFSLLDSISAFSAPWTDISRSPSDLRKAAADKCSNGAIVE